MSDAVVTVEGLSKAYRLGLKEETPDTLVGAATSWIRAPAKNFHRLRRLSTLDADVDEEDVVWALRDVSFSVQEGEVVGIIGRNGAGKSTLLKVLSRITDPTAGRVTIRGRVSSLLEVGTGFHPELTGRENVYMNGTILGMKKREIDRKFDEIVAFSGVERFLDTPIKRYSSGMQVRLAFSVAAHLEPEILIIDEVLAVGDVEFQRKSLGKMEDVARGGRTVLFVSHHMPAVRSLTSSGLYLRDGQIVFRGDTVATIERYLEDSFAMATDATVHGLEYYRRNRNRDSPVSIRRVWVEGCDESATPIPIMNSGRLFRVCCEIEAKTAIPEACMALQLFRNHEQRVVTLFSKDSGFDFGLSRGTQVLCCEIADLPLTPGAYTATLGINQNAHTTAFDVLLDYPLFEVRMPALENGELDWDYRPWGTIHWEGVSWRKRGDAE